MHKYKSKRQMGFWQEEMEQYHRNTALCELYVYNIYIEVNEAIAETQIKICTEIKLSPTLSSSVASSP